VTTTDDLRTAVKGYLAAKTRNLTKKSVRDYEHTLRELTVAFPEHTLGDFEPPQGSVTIKKFLDDRWGSRAPRTYNKHHSVLRDFFNWNVRRGRILADPTAVIDRVETESTTRTAFSDVERLAIFRANQDVRDSIPLRLLFDFGVRKQTLQNLRFQDFDKRRRQVTVDTRAGKRRTLEIVDDAFWADLDRLKDKLGGSDASYVLPKQRTTHRRPKRAPELDRIRSDIDGALSRSEALEAELSSPQASGLVGKLREALEILGYVDDAASLNTQLSPDRPRGEHGTHDWWYGCLERAGIVEPGVRNGHPMQKARHTAGRRELEKTGSLKAVQSLLGLGSIRSAEDKYRVDGVDELDATMRDLNRQLTDDGEATRE
jgi:integrase